MTGGQSDGRYKIVVHPYEDRFKTSGGIRCNFTDPSNLACLTIAIKIRNKISHFLGTLCWVYCRIVSTASGMSCIASPARPPLSALVSRVATRGLRLRIHIPYANGSEDQFQADCESTLTVRRRTFALPGREVLTLPIRLPERWFPPIARRIRNSKIDLLEHLGT